MSIEMLKTRGRILTVLCFLLCAEMSFGQPYSVTDLEVLPGGSVSVAYAINSVGSVAGYSAGTSDADYTGCGAATATKPFIWTSVTGMQVLGPPPMLNTLKPCGGAATGINDQGMVVGYLYYGFAGDFRSFVWTATNGMQLIRTSDGFVLRAGTATGVNNAGQVVGSEGGSAYRWSAASGVESLQISGEYSYAYSINSAGQIAGSAFIEPCNAVSVIWNAAGQLQRLSLDGFLATLPSYASVCGAHAQGLNDSGVAVGSVGVQFTSGDRGTFAWLSENDVSQPLGQLPLGSDPTPFTEAYGINKNKAVVGQSNNFKAFLWTPENGIRDLNSLLDASGVGWTLVSGNAINEAGQVVGYGLLNGEPHGFLLTPSHVCQPPRIIDADDTGAAGLLETTVSKSQVVSGRLSSDISFKNFSRFWLGVITTTLDPPSTTTFVPDLNAGVEGAVAALGLVAPCATGVTPTCTAPGEAAWTAQFCTPGSVTVDLGETPVSAVVTLTDLLLPGLTPSFLVGVATELEKVQGYADIAHCLTGDFKKIIGCVAQTGHQLVADPTQLAQISVVLASAGVDLSVDDLGKVLLKKLGGLGMVETLLDLTTFAIDTGSAGHYGTLTVKVIGH